MVASTDATVTTGIGSDSYRRIPASSTSILIGALGFLLVLILRLSGVIVGPTAIVLAGISLVLAPGPRRLSDRFIVFFAIGFGWMTLLGWIPHLETNVDVAGISLAILCGLAAANQFQNRRFRLSLRQWPLATEAAAMTVGVVATLWWAVPFLRLNLSGRLHALFPGWDNAAFFDMFRQILLHGSFSSIRAPGPGEGLPQTWALLARLWGPHPPTATQWVLNAYDVGLLLTLGAIVTLGCMSVARLCGRDFWVALPAMAAVVQIFVVGRLWIFNGYPTFDVPIAAAVTAVLLSWRKGLSPRLNFITIAGLTLVAAYTWYPIIVLSAPALIAAALRLIKACPGRSQTVSTFAVFSGTGIAFVAPLIHFSPEVNKVSFSYAANATYEVATWTPGTPWVLVVLSIVGLLAFVIVRRFTVRDRGLGFLAAPALIGAAGVLFLVASEVSVSSRVSYYGHKFAAGVYGMCLVVLLAVVASTFATSTLRRRLPTAAMAALACVASVALLEIDGYIGPSANLNSTTLATGFKSHQIIDSAPVGSEEAHALIASAQWAHDNPTTGTRWAFIDPDAPLNCEEADEWFYALSDELVITEYGEWRHLPCPPQGGDTAPATYVVSHYPTPVASHIHLFVSASLAHALIARNQAWNSPGVLHILPRLTN